MTQQWRRCPGSGSPFTASFHTRKRSGVDHPTSCVDHPTSCVNHLTFCVDSHTPIIWCLASIILRPASIIWRPVLIIRALRRFSYVVLRWSSDVLRRSSCVFHRALRTFLNRALVEVFFGKLPLSNKINWSQITFAAPNTICVCLLQLLLKQSISVNKHRCRFRHIFERSAHCMTSVGTLSHTPSWLAE